MSVLGRTAGKEVVSTGVFLGSVGDTYELILKDEINVIVEIDIKNETSENAYTEWSKISANKCHIIIALDLNANEQSGNYGAIDIKSYKNTNYLFSYMISILFSIEDDRYFYSCTYSVARETKT